MALLQETCGDRWETEARESPKGSVLTVSCERKSGPASRWLGTGMWNILVDSILAFLMS